MGTTVTSAPADARAPEPAFRDEDITYSLYIVDGVQVI